MTKCNRKDNDSHKYQIPMDLLEEFDSLFERMCNAKFMSPELWDLEDEFNDKFYEYMIG